MDVVPRLDEIPGRIYAAECPAYRDNPVASAIDDLTILEEELRELVTDTELQAAAEERNISILDQPALVFVPSPQLRRREGEITRQIYRSDTDHLYYCRPVQPRDIAMEEFSGGAGALYAERVSTLLSHSNISADNVSKAHQAAREEFL